MAQAFLNGSRYDSDASDIALFIDRSLTEYDIPEGVKRIGEYAFCYCRYLKRVTVPDSVTEICSNAFRYTALTELELPIGCTTLASYSMYQAASLTSIKLGDVKTIKNNAFEKCYACTLYDFSRCTTVPKLADTNAFGSINAEAKILVPAALYDEWIVATNWVEYADYIEADSSLPDVDVPDVDVPSVSEGLEIDGTWVVGRGSCTDSVIVIPDGITAIADGAFVNDQVIDTLVLPESGTQLGTVEMSPFDGSSLRKIVNYYSGISFVLYGLSIERISFIDSPQSINGLVLMGIQGSPVYDFSKCTAIVQLTSDVEYVSVGEDTQIIVPAALYDEWVTDTNWAYFADYIVAAE